MDRWTPKPVVHLELHTPAVEAACRFYEALCGWSQHPVETEAGTYLALGLGHEIGGGAVECGVPRPLWLPYVEVADIGAATERARALGARVAVDAREGPVGWRSVVASPQGGELALWQRKR